jgi:PKD repeat protein
MKKAYLILLLAGIFSLKINAQVSVVVSPQSNCAPAWVDFVASMTGADTYYWYFGDGSTANGQMPNHTYAYAGTYYIYVDAYNAIGMYIGSGDATITIGGQPDAINVSSDTICIGDEISLSVNNGVPYDNYSINYGNGSPTESNTWGSFWYAYPALGNYTATISVTDFCGTHDVSMPIVVSSNNPIDDGLLQIYSDEVCPGDEIYAYTNWVYTHVFDFGDGTPLSSEPDHTYTSPGTYVATVYLMNGCGYTSTHTDTIDVVTNLGFAGSFPYVNAWPDPQCPNSLVEFSASDGYAGYHWDFGDGNTSNLEYPDYSYAAPGTYNYSLTITNGCGADTTIFDIINIQTGLPVTGVYINAPVERCPNEGVHFSGEPDDATLMEWNFGDGTTGTGQEVIHTYTTAGTYNVILRAYNGCGSVGIANHTITISNTAVPDLNDFMLQVYPDEACPGDTIIYFGGPAEGIDYTWNFGDGNTSAGTPPGALSFVGSNFDVYEHAYNTTGVYNVSVTITNACGNSTSFSTSVSIGAGAMPDVGFLFDATAYHCLNEPVEFKGAGASQYEWNFGDGTGTLTTTGTLSPVYHTFNEPGVYDVTLTGYNNCGLSDESVQQIIIPDSKMDIFTNSVDANCGVNNGVAIVTISGGNSPYSIQWTNGDNTMIADSLYSGMYQVNITDSKGCTDFAIASVNDTEAPTISVNNVIHASCYGKEDGAIDISLIGNSAPYTYTWSNGSSTEDVNQLEAGPHEVIVQDANGCIASESIIINQPTPVEVTIVKKNAACGQSDGEATANVSGTSGPYAYIWSHGGTTKSVYGLAPGAYTVTVVDANGCLYEATTDISHNGSAIYVVDSINNSGCGASSNSVYLSLINGTSPISYQWSNGTTNQDLVNVAPGEYTLEILDGNGCSAVQTFTLNYEVPETQSICMVTVDPLSQKNAIVWEKPSTAGNVVSYNIYKESSQSGLYFLIGNQPYDSLSTFIDVTADPSIRSWRYKLTAVDGCGNESEYSQIHKTIHLTNNMGISGEVNLIWDYYSGMNYSSVNLWRYSSVDGWVLIQTMPSNLTSYTDATPPSGSTSLAYFIEGIPDNPCTATRAVNHNTTRSNRTSAISGPINGIQETIKETFMSLYPNPTAGNVTLYFNLGQYVKAADVKVISQNGSVVYQNTVNDVFETGTIELPLDQLSDGLYHVVLSNGTTIMNKRLIIQK